jgi:hypothetical protein
LLLSPSASSLPLINQPEITGRQKYAFITKMTLGIKLITNNIKIKRTGLSFSTFLPNNMRQPLEQFNNNAAVLTPDRN